MFFDVPHQVVLCWYTSRQQRTSTSQQVYYEHLRTNTDNITWKWCRSNVCLDLPVIISIVNRMIYIYLYIHIYDVYMSIMNYILNYFISFFHSLRLFQNVWVESFGPKIEKLLHLGRLAAWFRSPKWHLSMVRWEQSSFGGPTPSVSKLSKPKAKKTRNVWTLPWWLSASEGYRSEDGRQSLRPELLSVSRLLGS